MNAINAGHPVNAYRVGERFNVAVPPPPEPVDDVPIRSVGPSYTVLSLWEVELAPATASFRAWSAHTPRGYRVLYVWRIPSDTALMKHAMSRDAFGPSLELRRTHGGVVRAVGAWSDPQRLYDLAEIAARYREPNPGLDPGYGYALSGSRDWDRTATSEPISTDDARVYVPSGRDRPDPWRTMEEAWDAAVSEITRQDYR